MIAFTELGMIGGIVIAGYLLPGSMSLSVFLIASGLCFAAGNIFLFRKIKIGKSSSNGKPWPHIFRALGILAVVWLLILLLSKR
jgi:uncharacterized membrane protein